MKEKRYYIAYAATSMFRRCGCAALTPRSLVQLLSRDGSYCSKEARPALTSTIEECESGTVPVVIWEVTAADEAALDRYEGFPNFYYKKDIKLQYKGIRTGKRRTVTAFAYIMHEERPIGIPTNFYMRTCLEGYDTFYFDKNILIDAYEKCREVCGYEG